MHNKGDSAKCFANGMASPVLSLITYYVLYAIGILEELLRNLGQEPPITTFTVVVVITTVNTLCMLASALASPKCSAASVIGMWFMTAILIMAKLYEFVKIALPDILIATIVTTAAIAAIAYSRR